MHFQGQINVMTTMIDECRLREESVLRSTSDPILGHQRRRAAEIGPQIATAAAALKQLQQTKEGLEFPIQEEHAVLGELQRRAGDLQKRYSRV